MPNGTPVSGIPNWAQALGYVGIPGFIALAVLGFVPGVKSPIDRIETAVAAAAETTDQGLKQNRETQKQILETLRAICDRLPNTNPRAHKCSASDL